MLDEEDVRASLFSRCCGLIISLRPWLDGPWIRPLNVSTLDKTSECLIRRTGPVPTRPCGNARRVPAKSIEAATLQISPAEDDVNSTLQHGEREFPLYPRHPD